ncbi:MAG: fatty acid desaturase [Sandaracinaceae bacterium]|nr:fatty acid desaturase [Sandaracinaceae bacterium]MBK7777591.1 fatty acid desaturase [Sandaracinaceae bacterium]MBK8410002.1 fatty acid desaturase [Sandaracinaceae bacterium]
MDMEATDAPGERSGNALVRASRAFAEEDVRESTRVTITTLAIIAALWVVHALVPIWVKPLSGLVLGLTLVRGFVLFHDYEHGAILRGQAWAKPVYDAFGLLVLTPPKVWRDTHNYHHAHNAKLVGSHIGSYPTLSVAIWNKLSPSDRRAYALARNGFTILFAYLTVFLIGMCVSPLRRDARRNRSAWAALGLHVVLAALAFALGGAEGLLLGFLFPLNVAFVTGAYLFYAQHNFEGVKLRGRHEWEFTRAALEASSYMPMGPAMRWFTADIGYHHVHHLNSRIPFYRLAEAMDAIPELQHPGVTRLRPRDVWACLGLKLWDAEAQQMVPFPRGASAGSAAGPDTRSPVAAP